MPAVLTFDQYLDQIAAVGERLAATAEQTGLHAKVPTCPSWSVAKLLAHQTTVHRWAAAEVSRSGADTPSQTSVLRTHRNDLVDFYRDGLRNLLDTLRAAPADLQAMTFLNDVDSPRTFWARRQAHELTIHFVDGLSAREGGVPTTDVAVSEAGLDARFATDGLDELLRGFFTRGTSRLYDGTTFQMAVLPSDSDQAFHLTVGPQLTVSSEPVDDTGPQVTLRGTSAALHLALWNRGDDIEVAGDHAVVQRWRATQRIRWS